MIGPPPTSPLFPYTTLFRSQEAGAEEGTGIGLVVAKRLAELMGGAIGADSSVGAGSTFWFELAAVAAPGFAAGDRKSTRLNSSHLGISYAVFCLKKKSKRHGKPLLDPARGTALSRNGRARRDGPFNLRPPNCGHPHQGAYRHTASNAGIVGGRCG